MDGDQEQQIDGEVNNHENKLKEKKVLFHSTSIYIYIYIYFLMNVIEAYISACKA